jgi:uncharacterized protein (DUF1697 family)
VPTHLALLRGINVGGRSTVPMAALRELTSDLGHQEVSTYIQSGNLLFTPGRPAAAADLADELEAAVAAAFQASPVVVVLEAGEWDRIVEQNPYPGVSEPQHLHAVVRQDPFPAEQVQVAQQLAEECRRAGGHDALTVIGRTCYLHTPNGLGRSKLAERLSRRAAAGHDVSTARNWSTVLTLQRRLAAD